jgi:NitT/TauT family transport system substrate-binding protein
MDETTFPRLRRALFLTTSAAFVAAPRLARAQSLTKLNIGSTASGDIVVALWAEQGGIFQKYGLDADIQRLNNSAAVVAAVLGGSLDLGRASLFALVVAHAKGLPIVLEAPSALYRATSPDAALVVAANSPIRSARDLNGKLLASASLGDLFSTVNAGWIDQNGGDSRTVKYVELPGSATANAIVAGRVDAGMLADPALSEAVLSGKCRILGHPEDALGKVSMATAFFCSADFAAKNAALMARIRKAMDESAAYGIAHPAEMIPVMAKFSGIDPKLVVPAQLARASDLLDTRLTQPTIDMCAKYNGIPKAFPVREMIDPNVGVKGSS